MKKNEGKGSYKLSENRRSFCNAHQRKLSSTKCAFSNTAAGEEKKDRKNNIMKKEATTLKAACVLRDSDTTEYHLIRKLYGYPLYFDLNMERMREKKTAIMARPMNA